MEAIRIDKFGKDWIAHLDDCDCLADDAIHGTADHPTAALRKFLKARGE